MRNGIAAVLAMACLAFAAAAPAHAERHPEHAIALGWQTEHADVVLIADTGPVERDRDARTYSVDLDVREVLRGAVDTTEKLSVAVRDLGRGAPFGHQRRYLVFLGRVETADGPAWRPLTGSYGFREIIAGQPSAAFPALVREIAATLGPKSENGQPVIEKPDELRALLVRTLGHADDGIAYSGALDLVRHEDLRGGLTDAERTAVLGAFESRPVNSRARRALAVAVGVTKPARAATVLVDALLEPGAENDRVSFGEALRLLDDDASTALIDARLEAADPRQRRNLLNALGAFGGASAVRAATPYLADPDVGVRVEAAHSLGRCAQTARRVQHDVELVSRDELTQLVDQGQDPNEWRAALWALAQLDRPEAYDEIRRRAADDKREDLRRWAKQLLERPRRPLFLDN